MARANRYKMEIFPANFVVAFLQMLTYHFVNSASQKYDASLSEKTSHSWIKYNDEL